LKKALRKVFKFILLFLIVMWVVYLFLAPKAVRVSYDEFQNLLKSNMLSTVTLKDNEIISTIKPAADSSNVLTKEQLDDLSRLPPNQQRITTSVVNDPNLIQALENEKIVFSGEPKNNLWDTIKTLFGIWIFPGVIFFLLFTFLLSRMKVSEKVTDIGKSKGKVYTEKHTGITFKDVAGIDEAKIESLEIVDFLKNSKYYRRLGARAPKGVLLIGPPGTGKTLLARAIAGEAKVPFISINGSEFVELFVGVGAARVRDLFRQAHAVAPCIIFIDELDALGRQRDYSFRGNDEKEQTLNQLLSEMDGFDVNTDVIILAATNRPEILDSALLRAGRFDRQVLVDKPDKKGRLQILNLYIKKIHSGNIDLTEIAAMTPGFTGADLATLVNEAALLATRRNAEQVEMKDFIDAVERVVAGLERRNRLINPEERRITAYHEMGHTVVALALPGADPVTKVSIIQRGASMLGFTMQLPKNDRSIITHHELETKLAVMLGGRAAELAVFGEYSTGAVDDLLKVTDLARDMVMRYGMQESLGHIAYEADRRAFIPVLKFSRDFSEKTAEEIDEAIRKIVQSAFDKAITIIKKNKKYLDQGAKILLEKETLDKHDLATLGVPKE